MKRSNFGFTLAEVLITLAIIGVVAAMTIPTLVNKYQDRVNETRYKKALSMVSQAVQLSMAQVDSPGNMTHTDLWACKDKDDFDEARECFSRETKKLFKNVVLEDMALAQKMMETEYVGTDNPWQANSSNLMQLFTTGDGITFGYVNNDGTLKVLVDTNGASKPNNISKDLYALQIQPNGKVVDVTASLAGGGSGSSCSNPNYSSANLSPEEFSAAYDNWVQCIHGLTEEQCKAQPGYTDESWGCGGDVWWRSDHNICERNICY